MYQLNPIYEFFGFGKPKYSEDARDLAKIVIYISGNMHSDPDLKKDYQQLKKMGVKIYGSKYEYTNLILCCYTVCDQIKRYKLTWNDVALSSRSAKRLLEWGRSRSII